MEFQKYDLGNKTEKLAALFRPARSLYGYQGDNTPSNTAYAEAIQVLHEAFPGGMVSYNDWRDVVEVEGFVKQDVTKDTWYFNRSGVFSELYLTSELQLSYLTLALKDIEINVVGNPYDEIHNANR